MKFKVVIKQTVSIFRIHIYFQTWVFTCNMPIQSDHGLSNLIKLSIQVSSRWLHVISANMYKYLFFFGSGYELNNLLDIYDG